jgi:hypothetical protein
MMSRDTSTSFSALLSMLLPVASMSTHGDNGMVAAGIGRPRSRARSKVVIASPPPAESPVSAMCCGLTP